MAPAPMRQPLARTDAINPLAADQCVPARRVVTLTKRPSPWAERAMVVNPIDNADATPVRPPRTGGLRGQAHNENLT
jgi:hypothetical protein